MQKTLCQNEKARASNGESYDPTFTNNPHNIQPKAGPIIQPGRTTKGEPAVVHDDAPGIADNHYFGKQNGNTFVPGLLKRGGEVTIEFVSGLVCYDPVFGTKNPAKNYLNAKIDKIINYQIH